MFKAIYNWVKERSLVIWESWQHKTALSFYGVVGFYSLISPLLPKSLQLEFLLMIPWYWWIIGLLIFLYGMMIEHTIKEKSKTILVPSVPLDRNSQILVEAIKENTNVIKSVQSRKDNEQMFELFTRNLKKEKARLDLWFEFLDLKICQGKELYKDATLGKEATLEWFDEVIAGFKTAMKEGKYQYIINSLPYYWAIKNQAEYNFKTQTSIRGCQNTVQDFLKLLEEEYRDPKQKFTDLDLRPEFKSEMLNRYKGKKCP